RAQNLTTRWLSVAKATSPARASAVTRNSVKRRCDAKKLRSKALRLAKSGGLGNTPWGNANSSTGIPIERAENASTKNDAPIAEYVEFGTDVRTRKSLMMSPPRAGTTLLKP